jgi:hypothetical protein
MFYYLVFVLVTRYSTVRQLAFLLIKTRYRNRNKGGPAPAVPEGASAIKRQTRLHKMSQIFLGMRKAHGNVHHPQTFSHTKTQRDENIQRASVTGALRELTLAQPALLSASG